MRSRLLLLCSMFFIAFGITEAIGVSALPKQSIKHPTPTPAPTVIPSVSPFLNQDQAQVKRVVDGDTIELMDGSRVRYIGIDTPETVNPDKPIECYGPEASKENKRLVEGQTVRLEKDVSQIDKYGRLLRYVYVGDIMVNEALVRGGFAHSTTYPPDVKHQDIFRLAEVDAREKNRGLWSACTSFGNSPTQTQRVKGVTTTSPSGACIIKGNISATGDKIYHLPGCHDYAKTSIDSGRGEKWFCTEEDAANAGWRKAKNC